MATRYVVVDWHGFTIDDSFVGVETFPTIREAASHMKDATDYIVALEKGKPRPLNRSEGEEYRGFFRKAS